MELRNAFDQLARMDDVVVLYVVAANQMNRKSEQFIDSHRLRERVRFVVDPESRAIDRLRVRRENPEAVEAGVPHPATYVLDREGIVRFVDVREDFHFWLDPQLPIDALNAIP